MYFDVWAIKQSLPKYFDYTIERTPRILKRHIDKYGPGEILEAGRSQAGFDLASASSPSP
jgi:hypothetical protein